MDSVTDEGWRTEDLINYGKTYDIALAVSTEGRTDVSASGTNVLRKVRHFTPQTSLSNRFRSQLARQSVRLLVLSY